MYDYDRMSNSNYAESTRSQMRDWMLALDTYNCEGVKPFAYKGLFDGMIDRQMSRK